MSRFLHPIATTIALGCAFLLGGHPHQAQWVSYTVFLFGLINAWFVLPGTAVIRHGSAWLTVVCLLSPTAGGPLLAFAWLLWPPAIALAWATARQRDLERSDGAGPPRIDRDVHHPNDVVSWHARVGLALLIGGLAVAIATFRLLMFNRLEQTSALFVGIPALIAMVVTLTPTARSGIGIACKAITIALLISLMFLMEGFLCVLMSAPIFYLVAMGVAAAVDAFRKRDGTTRALAITGLLAVVPMSGEGVFDATTIERDTTVSVERVIRATPADVERALSLPPRFDRPLPRYLRSGFPTPVGVFVTEQAATSRWTVRLRGGEMGLTGLEPKTGDLVLDQVESRAGFRRWRVASDSSHMTHFLDWREASVAWTPIDETTTRVTWTLRYERGLDPAWYFGPMERYAVGLAAGYLIDAVATP
jgi:hypothetical protein